MGLLYSALLNIPLKEFLPYVTVGLIVWNLISASILEGSEVFIANEGLIKQLPSALSVHVYRLVWRQVLFFAHNFAIYIVLLFAFSIWQNMSWTALAAIPAFVLIVANTLWVSIVFGIFSTRYRDIAPILGSLTLLLFVLTPIMWTTQALKDQSPEAAARATRRAQPAVPLPRDHPSTTHRGRPAGIPLVHRHRLHRRRLGRRDSGTPQVPGTRAYWV